MKKKTGDSQEQNRSVPQPQLYQLATDLGEEQDVAREHPERVRRMLETLEQIQSQGRSRP